MGSFLRLVMTTKLLSSDSSVPPFQLHAKSWWWRFASPHAVFPYLGGIAKAALLFSLVTALIGLYLGFVVAPTDAQQGNVYRIIFLHVPAAWLSMVIYVAMCFWAIIGLVFNTRLSHMVAQALAPTGALLTFLALWTGALWGKPTWGTWWVWDARLTSELILLFLYLGFLSLHSAIDDPRRADKAAVILALVGVINVPIIYFSVVWWNTLHQGASISVRNAPSIATPMLLALLVMTVAVWAYAFGAVLLRLRAIILEREAGSPWLVETIQNRQKTGVKQ